MHKQSDNVEEIRLSREQRGSSQDGYSRYNQSDGSHDGYNTRADGYHSSSMPICYLHFASREVLLETTQGRGELPPNLVTKPSSYSSTEAPSSHTRQSLASLFLPPLRLYTCRVSNRGASIPSFCNSARFSSCRLLDLMHILQSVHHKSQQPAEHCHAFGTACTSRICPLVE